jgi:hypothetical protein
MLAKIQFIGLLIWPFLICAVLSGLAWLLDCPLWAVLVLLGIGVGLTALWIWFMDSNLTIA